MIGGMEFLQKTFALAKTQSRILMIFSAMAIGLIFPQFGAYSGWVQYLLIAMLFFSFGQLNLRDIKFPPQLLWVTLANIVLGVGAYVLLAGFDLGLAQAAFVTCIAPTAISSTVITSFLGRNVSFVSTAVLLTNLSVAVAIPWIMPALRITNASISTTQILYPVLITLLIPLAASRLLGLLPAQQKEAVLSGSKYSFLLWLLTLVIVVAKAIQFIESQPGMDMRKVGMIALCSLLLCVLNFWVGHLIGGKAYAAEASQSLGQKNNSFVVWVALTFINPMAALGPTFYILYHNLYNSWQIIQHDRQQRD